MGRGPQALRRGRPPVPERFREEGRIALEELEKGRGAELRDPAMVADCGYGDDQEFRAELQTLKEPSGVEITAKEPRVVSLQTPRYSAGEYLPGRSGHHRPGRPNIPDEVPTRRAVALAKGATDWPVNQWGEGTDGPPEGRFT